MHYFLRRWIPELSSLTSAELEQLLDTARSHVFGVAPSRWIVLFLLCMGAAMLISLLLIALAGAWFFASPLGFVLLVMIPGAIAPLLYGFLSSRMLLPEVRRLISKS